MDKHSLKNLSFRALKRKVRELSCQTLFSAAWRNHPSRRTQTALSAHTIKRGAWRPIQPLQKKNSLYETEIPLERGEVQSPRPRVNRAKLRLIVSLPRQDTHTLAPKILSESDVKDALQSLAPSLYQCEPFRQPAPDKEEIERNLEREAYNTVKAIFPGKKKRLVREYVESNFGRIYQNQLDAWNKQRSLHEASEAKKKERFDARTIAECEEAKRKMNLSLEGSSAFIEAEVVSWLSSIELPVSIDVSFDYDEQTGILGIDLDLPEIEDLPTTYGAQLSSGKFKEKNKTQKQLKEEYVTCVLGLTIFVAANMFNISTAIQEVVISGYTQRRNKDGDLKDDYIISVRFNRTQLANLPFSKEEPMETILKFENRMNLTASNQFKVIKPL